MLFNSAAFLFLFLPAALAVCLPLRGRSLLRALTLLSFLFYACAGHAWFLLPMLVTTCLDFFLGRRLAAATAPGARRAILWTSLSCNLGLLFYFKYAGLALRTVHFFAGGTPPSWASLFAVTLPAGISFYTFQTMSYMIDVYRGQARAETDFWKFAGFVSFFPHLVAGPLTRHHQLLPQLADNAENGVRPRWRAGVYLFALGLAKKVLIADRIAVHVDPIVDHAVASGLWRAWAALLGYAFQIYFDFSGYSDMALGLGRLFGIELPVNFNSPYKSLSPSEFWRRWHITLSLWLRDYLYISLGGNRCSERRRSFNLMATMVLGGLWHGANWTFAAWGFYHGLLLSVHHALEERWGRLAAVVQRALTFLLVTLGWVFFRAPSFRDALGWFARLAGLRGLGPSVAPPFALALAVGAGIVWLLPNAATYERYEELPGGAQLALGLAAVAAVLTMGHSSRFLYFQF